MSFTTVLQPWMLFRSFLAIITFYFFFATLAHGLQNLEGIRVYKKNLHLSAINKRKVAEDLSRYRNADNIWDVLREEFSLPHYEKNPVVQERIDWYRNNQDFILRAASRAAPYLYYILQQVKERHLPAELVLLPIIESGYDPFAISYMGASGLWQMMPGTANGYGIRQDSWYDGRRDIIASTRAALNYLAYLQSFFEGNWLRAIAAYNTGEGNVLAAIKRNIRHGRGTDFWSLPVAQQTRDYVPSLLALATIISHPEQYQFYFPPVRNAPYLAQVDVGKQINLKYAATLAGLSFKKLSQLNPGYNRVTTSKHGPYKLVLPIENVVKFTENLARSPYNTQFNWVHYKVQSGDTLVGLAKKFKTTTVAIKKMNHLQTNSIKLGLNLLIPDRAESIVNASPLTVALQAVNKRRRKIISIAKSFSKPSSKYVLQPGDTVYMIRSRDTLDSVAKNFHLTTTELLAANGIGKKDFKAGIQIIIPTHQPTNSAANSNQIVQPGDTVYMVRKGDTIDTIAEKFNTSASAIRLANLMERRSLEVGEKLIIPTHLRG